MTAQEDANADIFTNADAREMARLLAKFARTDLDQHQQLIVETPQWGPVFVEIDLENHSGTSSAAFDTVWPLPPHLDPDGREHATVWVVWAKGRSERMKTEMGRFESRSEAAELVVAAEADPNVTDRYWIGSVASPTRG